MRASASFGLLVFGGLIGLATAGATTLSQEPPENFEVLDGHAEPLRGSFNSDLGKIRVLLYVSPTCGGCLRGAKAVQEHLLDTVETSDLAVYVVWAPRNGAREKHVDRVTDLITDERATHYWDEYGAIADPYDEVLDLTGPCAGIFAIYGTEARWEDGDVPSPEYTEDAHADEFDRAGPQFDPKRFVAMVSERLDELD